MKYLKMLMIMLCLFIAGCASTYTVKEFDKDGKVIKETQVDESAVKALMDEMKNKNIAWGTNGWAFGFEFTIVSSETYVPVLKVFGLNANKWHVSFTGDSGEHAVNAIKEALKPGLHLQADQSGVTANNSNE